MINPLTQNEEKWIRKIWISYWAVIGLHALAQLFSYWFLPYSAYASEFYIQILLIPTFIMCNVVLSGWLAAKALPQLTFYWAIAAGTAVAVTIIRLNTDIRIVSALFLLPILVSVLFYSRKLTAFAAGLQLFAFGALLLRDEGYRNLLSAFDIIAVPAYIVMCALVAGIILVRGRELQQELIATATAKQELMLLYAVMRRQAEMDEWTGLYNQTSFREHFRMALEYGAKHPAYSFQLALIDIDDFKSINDTYGHRAGDAALAEVARVIRENVPDSGIAARYGGEEFAVLLFEAGQDEAIRICEEIRLAVSRIRCEELNGRTVTVSGGVSVYEPGMDADAMFEQTDARLYRAKRQGKNRVVSASE